MLTCVAGMNNHLARLAKHYGRQMPAQAEAQGMLSELESITTEEIFEEGLHEFLTRFIAQNARLGAIIHDSYLSGDIQ